MLLASLFLQLSHPGGEFLALGFNRLFFGLDLAEGVLLGGLLGLGGLAGLGGGRPAGDLGVANFDSVV